MLHLHAALTGLYREIMALPWLPVTLLGCCQSHPSLGCGGKTKGVRVSRFSVAHVSHFGFERPARRRRRLKGGGRGAVHGAEPKEEDEEEEEEEEEMEEEEEGWSSTRKGATDGPDHGLSARHPPVDAPLKHAADRSHVYHHDVTHTCITWWGLTGFSSFSYLFINYFMMIDEDKHFLHSPEWTLTGCECDAGAFKDAQLQFEQICGHMLGKLSEKMFEKELCCPLWTFLYTQQCMPGVKPMQKCWKHLCLTKKSHL